MGLQLWFHAHGIDESNVHKPYRPKSRGIGNSQILPYDYHLQADIELVFREMAEQVAIRLRRKKRRQLVSIHASYSKIEGLPSIHCQQKIEPTQSTKVLSDTVLQLFSLQVRKAGAIRQVGVFYGELVEESLQLFSLFDDPVALEKEEKLQQTIDRIRDQFGFTLSSERLLTTRKLTPIARSKLNRRTFRRRLRWINMIDRSYLPYQSAREFQDRGMAKWAGFFYPSTQPPWIQKKLTAVNSTFFLFLNRSSSWSRPFNNKRRSRLRL